MACRVPDEAALQVILKNVARIVTVSEDEIRAAMRHIYVATHNVPEGAGAVAVAAAAQERSGNRGNRVGVVLSGANVDSQVLVDVLSEQASGN
jgi:threonine dehydratase